MPRHMAAAARERCGWEGGRKKAGKREGNEEEGPAEQSIEEAERWEQEGKGGGEGFKGSQTLCTPSRADAIFCLAEWSVARLYLYPRCHFRASTSPECTHAILLQRGRLAVLSAESRHGSVLFISPLQLKAFTRLTYFLTLHLMVDTRCRLRSYCSLAAFKLAGPSVRKQRVNKVDWLSSGSSEACQIAVLTGCNSRKISCLPGGGLFEILK